MEGVDTIHTRTVVQARIRSTIIDVGFTVRTIKPQSTIAAVAIEVIHTNPIIQTRIRVAVVNVLVAILARPSRKARAFVATDEICTFTVFTGAIRTVIDVLVAEKTGPTLVTVTAIRPGTVNACAVYAKVVLAIIAVLSQFAPSNPSTHSQV